MSEKLFSLLYSLSSLVFSCFYLINHAFPLSIILIVWFRQGFHPVCWGQIIGCLIFDHDTAPHLGLNLSTGLASYLATSMGNSGTLTESFRGL